MEVDPAKTEAEYAERSRKWTRDLFGCEARSTPVLPAGVWESNSRVLPLNANKTTFQCLVNILERKPGSFQTARQQQPRTPSQSVIRSCLQREGGTRSPRGNRPACSELWSQHQPLRLCHTEKRKDLRQQRQASLSSGAQVVVDWEEIVLSLSRRFVLCAWMKTNK